MRNAGVNINNAQCITLAHNLQKIDISTQRFSPLSVNLKKLPKSIQDNFLFILIAICHDTKSLSGNIQGISARGWDFLLVKMYNHAVNHPEDFAKNQLQRWTMKKLQTILSETGNPETCTISDPDGRIKLLHDLGKELTQIGGQIRNLYRESKRKIGGESGMYSLLQRFQAYQDPHMKKSTVFLKFASQNLGWVISDPENLVMPIDYHNQRIALRYGLIDLPSFLSDTLRSNIPVDEKIHMEIRLACQKAYHRVIKQSSFPLFTVDTFLWNLGRKCCPHNSQPHCKECYDSNCVLEPLLGKKGILSCVLAEGCKGAADPEFRTLKECNIVTQYY